MRVWVIDDESEICQILAYLLKRDGHEIRTFENPLHALDAITTDRPETVICDFKMPQMNGLEVFKNIKKTWHGHFIILTGEPSTDPQELTAQGIREVLFKPRDLPRIQTLLRELA